MGRAYSCWMLNCWCITWPVGFKQSTPVIPSVQCSITIKKFTYLWFSVPQLFPTTGSLLRLCCGSSCSAHPTVLYVHTPKKSISLYQQFSSRNENRALMCFARNYTTHCHTRLTKTKWFGIARQSAKHVLAARRQRDRLHFLKHICLFCRFRPCLSG